MKPNIPGKPPKKPGLSGLMVVRNELKVDCSSKKINFASISICDEIVIDYLYVDENSQQAFDGVLQKLSSNIDKLRVFAIRFDSGVYHVRGRKIRNEGLTEENFKGKHNRALKTIHIHQIGKLNFLSELNLNGFFQIIDSVLVRDFLKCLQFMPNMKTITFSQGYPVHTEIDTPDILQLLYHLSDMDVILTTKMGCVMSRGVTIKEGVGLLPRLAYSAPEKSVNLFKNHLFMFMQKDIIKCLRLYEVGTRHCEKFHNSSPDNIVKTYFRTDFMEKRKLKLDAFCKRVLIDYVN